MGVQRRQDSLFCLLLGEGCINLGAAYVMILIIAQGGYPSKVGAPATVFLTTALLLILTSVIGGLTHRTARGG